LHYPLFPKYNHSQNLLLRTPAQ